MIDMAFLLITFFIMSIRFGQAGEETIELPNADQAREVTDERVELVTVNVSGEGVYLVSGIQRSRAELYRDIEADPDWEGVPSSLEFCFDDRPDGRGQYVAVVPEGADADSPVVVFLHGFGGLFQSQVELISRHLPEAVILAPAYRESWREGSPQYVDDMLADADERLGFELKRPVLVGLSDGGQAAFRIVTKRPLTYRGMASVAMTPRGSLVREMPKDLPVLMINGTQDQRVNIEHARLRAKALSRRLVSFALVEIEADHFLLLTHANQSFALLREFMGLEPAARDEPAPAEA